MKIEIIYYISAFILTLFGVELFRRWSLKRQILDIPNERSSHSLPTPRGGGIVFVLISLLSVICYKFNYDTLTFLFCAIILSIISLIDDLKSVSSLLRFSIHFLCAILLVYTFGSIQAFYLPIIGDFQLGFLAIPITILWIMWLTNAYNFMDGIDGIAATQAITAGIGWFLLGKKFDIPITTFFGLVLATSSFGFLIHNWSPAKIFMGDVGSAFLGFSFAFLPLLASKESPINSSKYFLIGVLLVFPFLFDTIFTIIRRLFNREKIWQAHRSHLYQRLIIKGYSHRFVTTIYGVFSAIIIVITFIFV